LALDLILCQATDPRQGSTTVSDGDGHHDFVSSRGIVDSHFHAVEVTADECRVLVSEWNVENNAATATLL